MTQYYKTLRPKIIINEEIKTKSSEILVSKTNLDSNITYVNDTFSEVYGYSKAELFGEPHDSLFRHPDMPEAIIQRLRQHLKKEETFHLIIKCLTKDGRYFWAAADYYIDKDENGEVIGYSSRRKLAPKTIVSLIEPLYQTLIELEKAKGLEISELYLDSYLQEKIETNYNDFIVNLFEKEFEKENDRKNSDKIKKTVSKKLSWFFTSDYE